MAKKEAEPKVTIERTYVIPLRKEWLKVPEYKRGNKAVKAIKQFLVRHMKIYDRDLKKVKIDIILNNELRFRGMRKPPAKIKVKVKKFDDNIVRVELAEIPKIIQYKLDREKKKKEEVKEKKTEEEKKKAVEEAIKKETEKKEPAEKKPEEEEETKEEIKEKKEKKEAVREAGLKRAKAEHKALRHEMKVKPVKKPLARKALEK